jgi:hypothetical protein
VSGRVKSEGWGNVAKELSTGAISGIMTLYMKINYFYQFVVVSLSIVYNNIIGEGLLIFLTL